MCVPLLLLCLPQEIIINIIVSATERAKQHHDALSFAATNIGDVVQFANLCVFFLMLLGPCCIPQKILL